MQATNRFGQPPAAIYLRIYLVLAVMLLGVPALVAGYTLPGAESSNDIWQHMAAIDALRQDIFSPLNPYVDADYTSRHFQPFWVSAAFIGEFLDISTLTILKVAGGVSAAILAFGIYYFASSYETNPLAPSILLVLLTLGWSVQLPHTGYTSLTTLFYGIAFPATTMVGLCLLLWGLVIRALAGGWIAIFIVPLVALMLTTHQLGAAIGLIAAGCIVLLWPNAAIQRRVLASILVCLGMSLAALWPYHNPYTLVLMASNVTWIGGPDFYGPLYMFGAFVPSLVGLAGLTGARARPFMLTLAIFGGLYILGSVGPKIGTRFMMPTVLILHIGLTSVCLRILRRANIIQDLTPKRLMIGGSAVFVLASTVGWKFYDLDLRPRPVNPTLLEAAEMLTSDIDNLDEVATHYLTAWPVVAVGQKVHAIPWPEPGISDLGARQTQQSKLFDPALEATDRIAQANHLGIKVLIADERYLTEDHVEILLGQSISSSQAGPLRRFDLSE